DGDPVSGFDPGRHQRGGEGPSLLVELGVGQPTIAVDDGEGVTDALRRAGAGGGGAPKAPRGGARHCRDAVPAAAGGGHRTTASATFINWARLPPMILRTVSSGRPASSST